jgi:hypothetical protein
MISKVRSITITADEGEGAAPVAKSHTIASCRVIVETDVAFTGSVMVAVDHV